ncbi:zinc-dependent alcohol dehydrogenase [Phytohalomonas tamaricis]|uniref:zinc-dependent alcohol dehydrogenase n=1 Tax=Phytohalomonas tamaricis TaxID=2081032 RepID=UPI000D0BDA2E|nr:zinc-binding alcohol dehydrogenase [Phytohalomonas tamaricis]
MQQYTAQAFWTLAPGQGVLREQTLINPTSDDVLVRTCYSAISRGTESLVFKGHVPPSEYARMRAPFQEGEFPGPVKYGYANVGIVEQGPDSLLDRHVFCLYPHQDRYVVPAARVVPLPPGIDPARAVLAANMETAINGLWDAAPRVGDRIAIIGAGVVGALLAFLCARIPGTHVQLIDIDERRAKLAKTLGTDFQSPDSAAGDNDLVIHASGAPTGLKNALQLAGHEATIIEMSWFGQQEVSLPLGEAFHARRLTIRASQVGTVSPARVARWDYNRRMALALELLNDKRLDALIDGESAFSDLPATMPWVVATPGTLCHRIRYFDTPNPSGE